MREYGIVSPKFWTGKTGKSLRGDPVAQVLALYLMTCPHASMIGVFYCPVGFISHETGIDIEGALEGLARLSEGGFCTYNPSSELVFVTEMAKYQIGASLKPKDNRVAMVAKDFERLPEGPEKLGFYRRYAEAFFMPAWSPAPTPFEGASDPLRSQKQKQKQDQEQNKRLSHTGTNLSVDADGVIADDDEGRAA